MSSLGKMTVFITDLLFMFLGTSPLFVFGAVLPFSEAFEVMEVVCLRPISLFSESRS